MFTKITLIILAIAIVMQSYCIRVLIDMMDEIQEGYKLIDGRISDINHRTHSNEVHCKQLQKGYDYLLLRSSRNDI